MKTSAMMFAASLLLSASVFAQSDTPKPGPELKKLEMFAGSWTLDGDIKPGPMGPGGKITETEKCDWMDGQFFVVCHLEFGSPAMGNGTGISVIGYSTDDKLYTYREFNSWGEFDDSKGSFDNDTWTWTSNEKMGNTPMKGKFTMKILSSTSYNFMFEISPDGTKWTTVMDGKASKK
jgi:hypothetical protein